MKKGRANNVVVKETLFFFFFWLRSNGLHNNIITHTHNTPDLAS